MSGAGKREEWGRKEIKPVDTVKVFFKLLDTVDGWSAVLPGEL